VWSIALCAVILQGRGHDSGQAGADVEQSATMLERGSWRAWLESPGGELPFALEIERTDGQLSATFGNGEEKIVVPLSRIEGGDIVFDIPHYDSRITARIAPLGTRLDGEWRKRSGVERWTSLRFHAVSGQAPRFTSRGAGDAALISGRWAVQFESEPDPAVAILRPSPGGVEGTFLTSTGDFRWLAGSFEAGRLRLSCFDGAHAFLFDAKLGADGRLAGGFWSGDRWHDPWTAVRDENATIPDGFERARWKEGFDLGRLVYPDLDGKKRSLGEKAFAGRAMVIQVLGSWCPNCHDETAYLARVHDEYKERGLSIVGLAFEMTGDFSRDSGQVIRMRERHKASYPFLLGGLSDKQKASEALPALDRVLAFPTTIFLHGDGRVRAVHSGFAGPGTKEEHEKLKRRFEGLIEELLAEPGTRR